MPTQGGIHGSLLHAVPVPLPVFRTPPLWPMDADPWGSRSSRNGHSQPQWRPPTAHLESPPPPLPGADPRCERTPTPPRAARFRPGPAGLPAGSQPYWRPPGAQQGPTPHPQRAESRPVQPRFTPPWLRSRRVSSCSGHLREHNWEALPYPRQEPTPTRAARDRPAPGVLPGRCPLPPGAPGEPRPHARFQERLSDLAAAARSNMRTIHTPHRDNPSCL